MSSRRDADSARHPPINPSRFQRSGFVDAATRNTIQSNKVVGGQTGKDRWTTRVLESMPVLVPLFMLGLQLKINPSFDTLGSDFMMLGVGFDVWAVPTLLSGRRVTGGGLRESARGHQGIHPRRAEGITVAALIAVHFLGVLEAAQRLRVGESTFTTGFFILAAAFGFFVPLLFVLGMLPWTTDQRSE